MDSDILCDTCVILGAAIEGRISVLFQNTIPWLPTVEPGF